MFESIIGQAQLYSVNPTVFLIIYITSFPFYYYPLLRLRSYYGLVKNGKKITSAIFFSILVNRLAWASPYLYVIIVGENLPIWIYTLVVGYLVVGLVYFLWRLVNKRSEIED